MSRGFGVGHEGVVISSSMANRLPARSFLDLNVYKLLYDTHDLTPPSLL